jgi:hypothetical protein
VTTKKFLMICASPIILLALISPFVPKKPSEPVAAEAPPPEPEPEPEPAKPDVELLDYEGTTTEFGGHIEGRIRNNQAKALRRVYVSFTLYNDAGERIGKAWTTTDGLEPGETWKFKASSLMKGWTKFQVEEITGF